MTSYEDRWTSHTERGSVKVTTAVVTVGLNSALIGWVVSERYGPLTRRRWYLNDATAKQRYEAATAAAQRYVDAFKASRTDQPTYPQPTGFIKLVGN